MRSRDARPLVSGGMSSGELLVIIGPPAVGKMTVGRALCARSDFRLFHNHHTIEPLADVFGFGSPSFDQLKDELRRDVAIRLLTQTSLPPEEIGVRTGFEDPTTFYRAFKRWTGCSPGVYRRMGGASTE